VRGSFQETAPRKTAENTLKHCDDGVVLVLANHRDGGESSAVETTLGALSETVEMVSLRTVPRLFTCQHCILILANN